jgi:hypothetical protein
LSYTSIESVVRTKPISVTALAGASECPLRTILESESRWSRLPDPPEALLGSLVHRAIEVCGESGPEAVVDHLLGVLEGPEGVFRNDASASGESVLAEILGASRVSAKLAAARRITETIAMAPRRAVRSGRGSGMTQTRFHPRPIGDWREVGMSSDELQLQGRLDFLRVTDARCTLVDFKTGKALDDDGSVSSRYADQLHLYLLLARANGYGPQIRMEIAASDGRIPVPESDIRTSRLCDELKMLTSAAPLGVETDARNLARFCASCATCRFRPWCAAYLESAPSMWNEERPRVGIPFDIWGNVESVRAGSPEQLFLSVLLRDAANRLVSVTGVPARFFEGPVISGVRMGFFAVRARSTGRGHPQNFVLADPADRGASAHAALVLRM